MKKSEKQHMAKVAELGCLICGRPAELHHVRVGVGMGQRGKDVVPLCPDHHRLNDFGRAIHNGYNAFCERYGTSEYELVEKVSQILEGATT